MQIGLLPRFDKVCVHITCLFASKLPTTENEINFEVHIYACDVKTEKIYRVYDYFGATHRYYLICSIGKRACSNES